MPPSSGEYQGRHVIVTGGTGALGSALAHRLIEAGAQVSVPVHDPDELRRFGLASHDAIRIVEGIDLTDEPSVERFYRTAAEGGLWASIHVAGGFAMKPLLQTSRVDFITQVQMNAVTCFLCCREAVRAMKGGGRIVNVAARPGVIPELGAGMVAYTASKAAVAAITQSLAAEVAKDGILVNAVVPSIMDTHANRAAMPKADHAAWPKVDEVAATICFLASPSNAVTRGALVPVYGKS